VTIHQERQNQVWTTIHRLALEQALQLLDRHAYTTHGAGAELVLAQTVLAYRHAYRIEHCVGQLKGESLSLRPMYVDRSDQASTLILVQMVESILVSSV